MKQSVKKHLRSKGKTGVFFASALTLIALTFALAQVSPEDDLKKSTSAGVPPDQISRYPDSANPDAVQWARFAIEHPKEAGVIVEALKTPEQKARDQWKRLAILDPVAYQKAVDSGAAPSAGAIPQNAAAQSDRAKALRSILKPQETASEWEHLTSPEQKQREALAKEAMLHPEEFNERANRLKSPAQLEAEAQALRAVMRPAEFNEELRRLGKPDPAHLPAPVLRPIYNPNFKGASHE